MTVSKSHAFASARWAILLAAALAHGSGCAKDRPRAGAALAQGPIGPSPASDPSTSGESILFFFDPDCPDCALVKESFLEPFASHLGLSLGDVAWKDVTKPEVARELLDLERNIGFRSRGLAPVLVARGKAYCDLESIRRAIEDR